MTARYQISFDAIDVVVFSRNIEYIRAILEVARENGIDYDIVVHA